jgi:hypothetical protein
LEALVAVLLALKDLPSSKSFKLGRRKSFDST